MADSLLPPLPKISGDFEIMLDVFTHDSLRMGSELNTDYGDTSRLREMGKQALALAVTSHLYNQRPMLDTIKIQEEREQYLSDENLDQWLTSYGLKDKLRVAPTEYATVIQNPKEMAAFFHVYVGALYIRNGGLPVVQNWISRLISPDSPDKYLANPTPMDGLVTPQMNQYAQQQQQQQQQQPQQHYGQHQMVGSSPFSSPMSASNSFPSPTQGGSQLFMSGTPPLPPQNPPPLPSGPGPFSYAPSASLSLVTLALVNQTAAQKSIVVTYPAEQTGPPHQPTWTVKCCMNGQERGRGVAKSQKLAKEEAARQAWAAMGWGPT